MWPPYTDTRTTQKKIPTGTQPSPQQIFFKHPISSNDIAVLELEKEVDLDIYTPVCLAKKEDKTA